MNFNERIWELTKKIPKGKVTTYKALAEAAGSNAYRAVGNAMNKNPHAPFVPCHRVVASTGHLHGYAYGLDKKKKLLESEGVEVVNGKVNLSKYFVRV